MAAPRTHACDAPGCAQQIHVDLLMCRRHWFLVPYNLRRAINAAWRRKDMDAWLDNRTEAKRIVAKKESLG